MNSKAIIQISIISSLGMAPLSGMATSSPFLKNHQIHYSEGVRYEKQGDYQQAIKHFSRALGTRREDVATLVKLGRLYTITEVGDHSLNLKKAVDFLSRAQSISPNDALIYLLLAQAQQELANNPAAIHSYERAMTVEPDNVLLKINLGLLYFETKEFKKSIELLNKVILAYPDNLKARSYLGAALQSTENYLAAIEQYNYVLQYEPNQYSIIKNIADSWLALEDLDKAKEYYLKAQKVDPHVPDIYVDLAYIDHKKKNYSAAIDNYKKALELKDNTLWRKSLAYSLWANDDLSEAVGEFDAIEEHNVAAYIHQVLGDKNKAIESYKKAIVTNPDDIKSRFNLARIYHEAGDYKLAQEQYQKVIEQKPNDLETLFLLAVIKQENSSIEQAIKTYNELLANLDDKKLQKELPASELSKQVEIKQKIYFNLGLAYKSQNNLEQAEKTLEQVLALGEFEKEKDLYKELSFIKIALDKSSSAEALLEKWLKDEPANVTARDIYADFLIHESREREAVEQLRLASVLDKTSTSRLKLANLLHSQNNLYDALAEYELVIRKEPNNLNALLGSANNFKALGLQAEAMALYQQALEKYPNDLLANYNYGLLLQEDKSLKAAVARYEKVAQINPNFIDNYYVLGLCYWDLEEKDKAIEAWNKFLVSAPDNQMKREVIKLIHEHNVTLQNPGQQKEELKIKNDDNQVIDIDGNHYTLKLIG